MPHSIALAATGLDPENGLGVVKAWVESGGDVLCDAGANLEATEYDGETGHTPLAIALATYHLDNMDYLRLLLRRGASLDFPRCSYVRTGVARDTAEATLRSQLYGSQVRIP